MGPTEIASMPDGTAHATTQAGATRIVSLASVELAIRDRFPSRIADGNVAAARAAFELEAVNA